MDFAQISSGFPWQPIHRKMTQPTDIWACTYAHIEILMCTAHSSALHKRILQSNIFKKKDDHNQRNTISNKTSIFPRRPLTKLRRPQPKNLNNLNQKFKMTSPKKKLRWPHPKSEGDLTQKWRWTHPTNEDELKREEYDHHQNLKV